MVELEISGDIFPVRLRVIDSEIDDYDVIIGLDFLKSYKNSF